ncbi:MAG: GNAT family N-acetyltransferase [Oscillospiraceae bacterium]|nr:GNAT family N-acetyltransferase [Oscillospiraceae bacterium]
MELTYSPVYPSDAGAIFGLCKALIDQYEDISSIDHDRVLTWVRRKIEENISEYRRIMADGVHAGYFHFCPAEDGWELDDLYVFPAFRNRGIGTAVIRDCCLQGPVMLYVFTKNTGALALYRRLGFREVGTAGKTRLILRKE